MSQDNRRRQVLIVGAGSTNFGPLMAYDLLSRLLQNGDTLCLVDVDEEALRLAQNVAVAITNGLSLDVVVRASTDRRELLPDSDAVLIAAEADRIERWKVDWEIPRRFEVQHTLGENRGPAGLSHTLRTVPLVLHIAKDIEELAPRAAVVVLTNPEDRIVYALGQRTRLTVFGYCDGLWDFREDHLGPLLDIPGENIHVHSAGINHGVWITDIREKHNGADLYARLVELAGATDWQPLGRYLHDLFGLWPHENDEHYGEYFPFASEFIATPGYDFEAYTKRQRKRVDAAYALVSGTMPFDQYANDIRDVTWNIFGDTPPSLVLHGLLYGEPAYVPNANIRNGSKIRGLPPDMIVEVPAIATPSGVFGIDFGALPDEITAVLYREGVIQKLAAEAAAEGSREKAIRALVLDPHISGPRQANEILDAFIDAHGDLFPAGLASKRVF